MNEKLKGFGPLYIINLERRTDRLDICLNKLNQNGLTNYNIVKAIDGKSENLDNFYIGGGSINANELATTLSHLKAIKYWLETNNTEYAIIMEDDFSFVTVNNWSFTWEEFINSIKFEYDILQLSITHYNMRFDIHAREDWNFSAGVYLIKRDYALKFIDKILQDGKWNLPERALADHWLYKMGNTYSVPLFTFDMETYSDVNPSHKSIHEQSRSIVIDFWNNGGLTLNK